jgi:hypothetical protein
LGRGEGGQVHFTIHPEVELVLGCEEVDHNFPRHPRIFINPNLIEPLQDSMIVSGNNLLKGRVMQASSANGKVRLVVDAGVPLTLSLTEDTYRQTRALVGDTFHFRIPPAAIEVLQAKQ